MSSFIRMGTTVSVAGASGYGGAELLRLLLQHPDLEIGAVTASSNVGASLGEVLPHLPALAGRTFDAPDPALLARADLVFLAVPHGQSAAIAAQLPESVKVVDFGADFRLADADAWERYYGGTHAGQWTYGFPELPGQRAKIAASTRIANPGCLAYATILPLAPLVAAGLIKTDDVVVVAATGTSGAGRSAKVHLLGSEVMGDVSTYKVGSHQHVPEIKQATGVTSMSFTPHLVPMSRGILATVTARPAKAGLTAADVREVLAAAYADEPFVSVPPEGVNPRTSSVYGGNGAQLQAHVDVDSGRVVLTSVIDNLGKGAAGQALQNANILLGLSETAGLTASGIAP
jgi:N-acetyl-gamma-glutamyl-phosphate reductase